MLSDTPIRYGRKRNGIKKEIRAKLAAWFESIDNDTVRKAAMKDTIVTGGAIASMLLGESVNDYDIYFRSRDTTLLVADYYVKMFNEKNNLDVKDGVTAYQPYVVCGHKKNVKGEMEERVSIYCKSAGVASEEHAEYRYFETQPAYLTEEFGDSLENKDNSDGSFRPVFMSENAITLSDKVQIVIRFYGEPDKIHDNYDFQHAMCYWDNGSQELHLPPEALECLLSRTLIYRGSLYPIASVFRTKKFLERGWRISAGQQLKMMWQISEIDLSNFETLSEQLTGVDQAYLHQVIEALRGVEPDKIDSSYVAAIIDKIFA